MRTRIGAWLLLGALTLLLELAGCRGSCCEAVPSVNTWQEDQTVAADCAGRRMDYVCQDGVPQARWAWCESNQQDCCIHDPGLAAWVSQVFVENPIPCHPAAPAAAATQTPVPEEAQVAPEEQVLPEKPVPPVEKPESHAAVLVLPKVVTVTPSPTPVPKAEVIPVPPPACLAPPVLFDPPDGKAFAAPNTVFRWKPSCELQSDQVYDILVSTDGGQTSTSVGTTRDTILPIDFLKWNFAGFTGNFSWIVRIRDASGKYVSCESSWFSMALTEIRGGPAAAPVQISLPRRHQSRPTLRNRAHSALG